MAAVLVLVLRLALPMLVLAAVKYVDVPRGDIGVADVFLASGGVQLVANLVGDSVDGLGGVCDRTTAGIPAGIEIIGGAGFDRTNTDMVAYHERPVGS